MRRMLAARGMELFERLSAWIWKSEPVCEQLRSYFVSLLLSQTIVCHGCQRRLTRPCSVAADVSKRSYGQSRCTKNNKCWLQHRRHG